MYSSLTKHRMDSAATEEETGHFAQQSRSAGERRTWATLYELIQGSLEEGAGVGSLCLSINLDPGEMSSGLVVWRWEQTDHW